jgi:hypothetical protein
MLFIMKISGHELETKQEIFRKVSLTKTLTFLKR